MKGYNDFKNAEELRSYYGIIKESKKEPEEKGKKSKEEDTNEAGKTQNSDNYEVHYAGELKEYNNIFKHIIIFTNDRDPKSNKTLGNIYEAVENLKKHKCEIIPEIHVFVASNMIADENEEKVIIEDDRGKFEINKESNLDTLIFSRLGVQGEDECEHIVQLLQDRGFLVLNPVRYSALACDKYESAVLFKKGDIPQPNFTLMTRDILYDDKLYENAMKEVYPQWDVENPDNNKELDVVCKILDGHGGTGVALIDGKRLYAWMQLVFAIDPEHRLLLQKKEEADGGDLRVHVLTLRDRQLILACMKRIKIANDFRSNVSLGATAEPVKLTPEQEQIALKTAQLSKLPWCAVDIMPLVKGSDKELGNNAVLEINASPGTDGISEVMEENFINILLNNLTDPNEFMLQDKIAGYIETVKIKFSDNISKDMLAKLDTGNSTIASCIEVGKYEEHDGSISFVIDGKAMNFKKTNESVAVAGDRKYTRPVIIIPEITLGLRKLKDVPFAVVEHRDNKTTNVLLNRDTLSKLGYVVSPSVSHILTQEMEKVKII